jgi:hypothetical protein
MPNPHSGGVTGEGVNYYGKILVKLQENTGKFFGFF